MNLRSRLPWFRRRQPDGIRFSDATARWASTRFSPDLQPVAAFVADLLCQEMGVTLSLLEPTTTFTVDLRMDDLEPIAFVMALDYELGIQIPEADGEGLNTISSLVSYLHQCLASDRRDATDA